MKLPRINQKIQNRIYCYTQTYIHIGGYMLLHTLSTYACILSDLLGNQGAKLLHFNSPKEISLILPKIYISLIEMWMMSLILNEKVYEWWLKWYSFQHFLKKYKKGLGYSANFQVNFQVLKTLTQQLYHMQQKALIILKKWLTCSHIYCIIKMERNISNQTIVLGLIVKSLQYNRKCYC